MPPRVWRDWLRDRQLARVPATTTRAARWLGKRGKLQQTWCRCRRPATARPIRGVLAAGNSATTSPVSAYVVGGDGRHLVGGRAARMRSSQLRPATRRTPWRVGDAPYTRWFWTFGQQVINENVNLLIDGLVQKASIKHSHMGLHGEKAGLILTFALSRPCLHFYRHHHAFLSLTSRRLVASSLHSSRANAPNPSIWRGLRPPSRCSAHALPHAPPLSSPRIPAAPGGALVQAVIQIPLNCTLLG